MALNWNVEECKNYKELVAEKEWPITNAMIWATIAIDMGEITEKNYKKFYERLVVNQQLNGAYLTANGEAYWMTLEDVKKRIGLYTNAGTKGQAAFSAKVYKQVLENGLNQIK